VLDKFRGRPREIMQSNHTIKNFGDKKVHQKGCCRGLAKKNLANVDLHRQSSINGKTEQFQTLMNIIKQTTYFPGFFLCHVLVACCLMMARCTVGSMALVITNV